MSVFKFSSFCPLLIKPAVVDRVSRAMVEVEGVVDSNKMTDGIVEEKMVLYTEFSLKFSLVVPIFAFFSISGECQGL